MRVLAFLLVCMGLTGCALDDASIGETRSQPYVDDANHSWSYEFFPQDMSRFESKAALDSNKNGVAKITCTLLPDHHLSGCRVVSESPPGWGFGNAALLISKWVTLHPVRKDGIDVASEVTLPFNF